VILRDGLKILKEEHTITALTSVPAGDEFERQLAAPDQDPLRVMVKSFAVARMSAEADAACGAPYGQSGPERTNSRNGYRTRGWDTRVGSIELAIPKLRFLVRWAVRAESDDSDSALTAHRSTGGQAA
jgi:hypothetical protein